jgi:hypothetical protein
MISHSARGPVDTTPLAPGEEPDAQKATPAMPSKPAAVPGTGRNSPDAPTEAVKL